MLICLRPPRSTRHRPAPHPPGRGSASSPPSPPGPDPLRGDRRPSEQATTRDSLGYIHRRLGHFVQAVTRFERALELFRELGTRSFEGGALHALGDAHHDAGDLDAAHRVWQDAFGILDQQRAHPGPAGAARRAPATRPHHRRHGAQRTDRRPGVRDDITWTPRHL
ncbi:tetratricopeptide repeat protein [Nonomuraea angiospora]|uniref:tetratricopeptide repeat protein n=1 Tax=Nonomuraea angiospora TaxID=46172 RepID=UPI00178BDAB8